MLRLKVVIMEEQRVHVIQTNKPFSLVEDHIFFADCVEHDETAHYEPSHQDIHCLPFCF